MSSWKPPAIPARKPGWERSYVAVMEQQLATPFSWAPNAHCLAPVAELCREMTGVDPMRGIRRHASETGALRQLAKMGFADVEQALAAVFPEIPLLRARRGDAGVLEQVIDGRPWTATFIVMGEQAVGKTPRGPVFVPVMRLKRTFAIGAF